MNKMNRKFESVEFLGARPRNKASQFNDNEAKEKVFISDFLASTTQHTRKVFRLIVAATKMLKKSVYFKWVSSANLYSIQCDLVHVALSDSSRTHHRNFLFLFSNFIYFYLQSPHENDTTGTCCINLSRPCHQLLPLAWSSHPATRRSSKKSAD